MGLPPEVRHLLYAGDCLEILRRFPAESVDSIVTDPPYGLSREPDMAEVMAHWLAGDDYVHTGSGFMGKSWDSFVPGPSVWRECLRVLKPGGHLLSFAGSRTQDLMGLAIRLAGFEIRDSIAWLYGSGFPKSLDVSKAIDKAAGAERLLNGVRNPRCGFYPNQCEGHDDAGKSQSGMTYHREQSNPATDAAEQWVGWGTALKPAFEPIVVGRKPLTSTVAANVLEHGTGALNIDACRVGNGRDKGIWPKTVRTTERGSMAGPLGQVETDTTIGRWPTNVVLDDSQASELDQQTGVSRSRIGTPRGAASGDGWGMTATGAEYDDQGGASRFFPVFRYQAKAPSKERPRVDGVAHATVKPLELMRWLVRLVTPPNGVVLDPFAGSGTTIEAALLERFVAIGIEREPSYHPLIQQRIDRVFTASAPNPVTQGLQSL